MDFNAEPKIERIVTNGNFFRRNSPFFRWGRKKRIHDKCLTVDTHCDTPMQMIKPGFNIRDVNESPKSRVDLPRMKSGGLDAMFFAAFTGQKPRTEEKWRALHHTLPFVPQRYLRFVERPETCRTQWGGRFWQTGNCRNEPTWNITRELLLRGYSEKEIKKIWGGNLLRVFNAVERYAKKNRIFKNFEI